jgi:hypothetical protein
MSDQELVAKLQQAQKLLSDVYHHACQESDMGLESLMSVADTCICEALDYLE